jgi:hypothetical protein
MAMAPSSIMSIPPPFFIGKMVHPEIRMSAFTNTTQKLESVKDE